MACRHPTACGRPVASAKRQHWLNRHPNWVRSVKRPRRGRAAPFHSFAGNLICGLSDPLLAHGTGAMRPCSAGGKFWSQNIRPRANLRSAFVPEPLTGLPNRSRLARSVDRSITHLCCRACPGVASRPSAGSAPASHNGQAHTGRSGFPSRVWPSPAGVAGALALRTRFSASCALAKAHAASVGLRLQLAVSGRLRFGSRSRAPAIPFAQDPAPSPQMARGDRHYGWTLPVPPRCGSRCCFAHLRDLPPSAFRWPRPPSNSAHTRAAPAGLFWTSWASPWLAFVCPV
jgi:hypothetical protein